MDTAMNPATRTLKQIKIERNDMDILDSLEVMFGSSTALRQKAILGEILGTDYDETMDEIEDLFSLIEGLDLNEVEEELIEY